jgi:Ran GTPase-activating protein (RanGAP) involved in mRNA processing and transport
MDINDVLLVYLLDYMRTKKYNFQVIKLVKNSITDEGMRALMSYLINDNTTQVLNLTSNQLTARSL